MSQTADAHSEDMSTDIYCNNVAPGGDYFVREIRTDVPASCRLPGILCALAVVGLCAIAPVRAGDFDNDACFTCHDDRKLEKSVDGKSVSLYVAPGALSNSVHSALSCVDCHGGIKDLPHDKALPYPQCGNCHEDIAKEYASSIHGFSRSMGASGAAKCSDCHGSHNILAVKNGDSPVFKFNLPSTCSRCHSNPGLTAEYRMKYPLAAAQYMEPGMSPMPSAVRF